MERNQERLGRRCRIRAHILKAHLAWAAKRWPNVPAALRPYLAGAEVLR